MDSDTCFIPFAQPRISLCPQGCVHLHIGTTTILMSADTLRAVAELASVTLERMERMPVPDPDHHTH